MTFVQLMKLEWNQAPQALLDYVTRYILRTIDDIKVTDERVVAIIKNPGFCYSIYQSILGFYPDDWQLTGLQLDEATYEVVTVILTRKSPTQNSFYRIAVSATSPHQVLDVASFNKGKLFQSFTPLKYELETIRRIYTLKLRYMNKDYRPTKFIPFERLEDEDHQVIFRVNHPQVFIRMFGPYSLFEYVRQKIDKKSFNFNQISSAVATRLQGPLNEYGHQLVKLEPLKWHLESIGLKENLTIDFVLLYHEDNLNMRLVLNGELQLIDIFNDHVIHPSLDVFKKATDYQTVSFHYRALLKTSLATTQEIVPLCEALKDTDVVSDAYQAFRDNFASRKIVVIGPSYLSEQDMDKLAYELGLPRGIVAYDYPDYEKLTGKSFDHLKIKPDKYLGIVLGPNPHSLRGLGSYPSLSSKFREEKGFPFLAEALSLTQGKNFKITKYSFQDALFAIMRHHLAQNNPC